MGLLGTLLFSFGVFSIAVGTECIPETSKCSKLWGKVLPHKYLIATEDELNSWCSKQATFYECLENVLLEGKNGNLSYLPTNLLVSKLFSEDICTDGSTSRSQLLSNADCINQLNTDFCILPEYLDLVTPDDAIPSTRCSQARKTFICMAATIVLNCGFDAGRLYRTMLKITRYSDEVCGIETSEGIPSCEENYSKSDEREKKLSEIYYGLFHRIGDVLDQDENELDDSVSKEDLSVTEAIQSAIDNLDVNLSSEDCDSPDCLDSVPESDSISCLKDHKENKPYMKTPIITEVFKEILFYNYSGLEYAVYWRQPEFTVIDNFECEHLQPSYMRGIIFRCKIEYRHNDPDCLSNATSHEKITPAFVRSFDPEVPCDSVVEFGPRPIWMKDMDEAYEAKRIRDELRTTSTTETPDVLTTSASLLHLTSSMFSSKKPQKWYEFDLRANNMNSIFPNDIHYEMVDLFMPDPENYTPPPMNRIKVGDTMFFLIYDPELTNSVENLTCSRMDECHPRGRGVWKCKMWRRKIEICDTCGVLPTKEDVVTVPVISHFAKPIESQYTVLETTEPTVIVDGSGILSDSALPDESITLVFSDEAENQEFSVIDHPVEVEIMNDLDSDNLDFLNEKYHQVNDIKENEKLEYNFQSDTDEDKVHFKVFDTNEDSESSEVAYEIDSSDAEEDEIIIADKNGFLSGNILLLKDLSDLIGGE